MRVELARLHERLGATIVYVTHDQVEAMTLGQRIAVFNQGRIEQVGTPMDVYHRPVSRFVAGFLGSPRINFLPPAQAHLMGARPPAQADSVGVRPEHLQVVSEASAAGLPATVELVEHLGDMSVGYVRVEGLPEVLGVKLSPEQGAGLQRQQAVRLLCDPACAMSFDSEGRNLQLH